MGMAIGYDPCIKCKANMCSMCKLGRLEHEKQSVEEMHGQSYYFMLDQAIESAGRFMAEHDAALAKKIFEEIEINIFKLETPYQTLHCIPSGFIEELKEKYIPN